MFRSQPHLSFVGLLMIPSVINDDNTNMIITHQYLTEVMRLLQAVRCVSSCLLCISDVSYEHLLLSDLRM